MASGGVTPAHVPLASSCMPPAAATGHESGRRCLSLTSAVRVVTRHRRRAAAVLPGCTRARACGLSSAALQFARSLLISVCARSSMQIGKSWSWQAKSRNGLFSLNFSTKVKATGCAHNFRRQRARVGDGRDTREPARCSPQNLQARLDAFGSQKDDTGALQPGDPAASP